MQERSFSSALVLFAHPDDAEFMCGGTIAKWTARGLRGALRGVHRRLGGVERAGREPRADVAPIREREQRAAAEVLGVASVTFLGETDGLLEVTPETRKLVTREVRRLRPEVLVAPDPSRLWSGQGYINHWDHKQAGLLALTAVMPDAPTRVMFQELEDEGIEPFEVPNLWLVDERARHLRRHHRHDRHEDRRARPARVRGRRGRRPVGARARPHRWARRRASSTPRPSRPSASLTTMSR